MAAPQSYPNHARYVPLFHFVLTALVFMNFFRTVLQLRHFSEDTLFAFLRATAFVLMLWYVRAFPLGVQDRLIRLELQLRVERLAPELAARFDQLTPGQMVALRFAGDDELAALMREVLDGKLAAPKEIKLRIQHWKPDPMRI